jgi:hypothetical protein
LTAGCQEEVQDWVEEEMKPESEIGLWVIYEKMNIWKNWDSKIVSYLIIWELFFVHLVTVIDSCSHFYKMTLITSPLSQELAVSSLSWENSFHERMGRRLMISTFICFGSLKRVNRVSANTRELWTMFLQVATWQRKHLWREREEEREQIYR